MTPGTAPLAELFEETPEELRRQALSHSSWVEERTFSYGRLAFLGDSVLGLSVATLLFSEHPEADIGELTKILNQAVSGRACAAVAAAFDEEIEQATLERLDFKSELQERLARRGEAVLYEVSSEAGPPHDRRFEIRATVAGDEIGTGSGRSKKEAEQEAARRALENLKR